MSPMVLLWLMMLAVGGSDALVSPDRISDSQIANIEDAPYTVNLLLDWSGSGVFTPTCAGAVIRKDVISSTAQCPYDTEASQWRVRAGSALGNSGGQIMTVNRHVIHPQFDTQLDYDFGLYFLANDLVLNSRTAIVPLPAQGASLADGTSAVITGWGATTDGGNAVNELRKGTAIMAKLADCQSAYASMHSVSARMLCTASTSTAGAPCYGDTGAPLVANNALYGHHSWALGCGRPQYPGVWANVPSVRGWIDQQLN